MHVLLVLLGVVGVVVVAMAVILLLLRRRTTGQVGSVPRPREDPGLQHHQQSARDHLGGSGLQRRRRPRRASGALSIPAPGRP